MIFGLEVIVTNRSLEGYHHPSLTHSPLLTRIDVEHFIYVSFCQSRLFQAYSVVVVAAAVVDDDLMMQGQYIASARMFGHILAIGCTGYIGKESKQSTAPRGRGREKKDQKRILIFVLFFLADWLAVCV